MQRKTQLFVAVLAAFTLAAPSSISAANPCTASLPTVSIKGEECPSLGSSETMNVIEQNVSILLQEVMRCMQLGRTPEYPANSCTELAEREPDIPSGNYWIVDQLLSLYTLSCT